MEENQKEIVIRLKPKHLKNAAYLTLILVLVGIITVQHYFPDCSIQDEPEIQGEITGLIITETITAEPEENETSQESNTTQEEEEEIIEESPIVEPEDSKLPITGEIILSIDKINYVIKGEDNARINSVQFTIINQNEDFKPRLKAYLESYGEEDSKVVDLAELEAGDSITDTSSKLTFGYNSIDQEQKLVLKLYNEKNKYIKTAIKAFKTD